MLLFFILFIVFFFFFFFSSRRRHTRSKRDWSSDVCSSDLLRRCDAACRAAASDRRNQSCQNRSFPPWRRPGARRSEERRVGKECRSRWAPYQEKKKGEKR